MNPDQPPQFNKPPSGDFKTETSGSKGKLSQEKMSAITLSAEVGKKIQEAYPEIAMDYINGLSLFRLVNKYDIQKRFGVASIKTAQLAIFNALRGYSGNFSDSYAGLITDPEILRAIGDKHKKDSGKREGELARDEKRGMFGMTEEERKQVGSRAGMNLYQTGKGIHAFTAEQKKEVGRASVISRGGIPFSNEEKAYMKSLDLKSKEYSVRQGRINAEKIARELNEKFHNGRDIRKSSPVGHFLRVTNKKGSPAS